MRIQTVEQNVDLKKIHTQCARNIVADTVPAAPVLAENKKDPLGRIRKQHIMRLFFSLKVAEKHMDEDDKDHLLYKMAENMVTSNFLSDKEQEKLYQQAIRLQYFS